MNRNNSNMFVSCRPQWAFYFYFMVILYFMWLTLRWAVEFTVDRSQHTVNTHADTHYHHPVLLAGGFRFSSLWSSAELWSSTAHRGQPAPFGSCRWLQRARYYSISFRFTVWCCAVSADRFSHLPLHSHFHPEGSYRRTQQPTLRKEMNERPFISNTKLRSKTPPLSDLIDKSASVWSSWSSKWIPPEEVSLAQRASLPRLCDWCLLSGPELQVHNQSKWANACWMRSTHTNTGAVSCKTADSNMEFFTQYRQARVLTSQSGETPSDWLHPDVWTPLKGAACKIVVKAGTVITITPLVSVFSFRHALAFLFSKASS